VLLLLLLLACSSEPDVTPEPSARRPRAKTLLSKKGRGKSPRGATELVQAGELFRNTQHLPISGEAVGVLDIDRDGWSDLVVVDGSEFFHLLRHVVLRESEHGFRSKSFLIGPARDGWSYPAKGLGLHDYDDDGLMDAYLAVDAKKLRAKTVEGGQPPGGYSTQLNNGDWSFRRTDLHVDSAGYKRTAVFGDFNRDGWGDIYVSNSAYYGDAWSGLGETNILVAGSADGFGEDQRERMRSSTKDFWVAESGKTEKNFKGTVVRDFDRDGLPDIVSGSLSDLWAKSKYALTTESDPGYQGAWDHGVYVFHNQSKNGDLRFEDVSHAAIENAYGTTNQPHVHSVVPGDFDNDGDFDLILSGYKGFNGHNSLQHNTEILRYFENVSTPGRIRFEDRTEAAGFGTMNQVDGLPWNYPIRYKHLDTDVILYPSLLAGASLDIDNDGDLDFVSVDRQITNINPETKEPLTLSAWLFLNDGLGRFELVNPSESGLWGTARDMSYGDFNRDGKLDLVFVDGSGGGQFVSNATKIFMNVSKNDNHFLSLGVSLPSNGFGIGTVVRAFEVGTGKSIGVDELRTDFCYRSKRDAKIHFGLGIREEADLLLSLPDGREISLPGVESNRHYRVAVRSWSREKDTGTLRISMKRTDGFEKGTLGTVRFEGVVVGKAARDTVTGDWLLTIGDLVLPPGAALYIEGEELTHIVVADQREGERG
jgi:hypothetical protein